MKKKFYLLLVVISITLSCVAQDSVITGTVISAKDSTPLAGVSIIVKGTTRGTATDASGRYSIRAGADDLLVFSFIGYKRLEAAVSGRSVWDIALAEDLSTLAEITVVSTGYQSLPKERVNGSFVQIDQELVNRRVSTDLLSRLEDVSSGLMVNRNIAGRKNDITIRGMGTINSQAMPLIVIDNFPYDGDLNTINPNDVESVTLLKDAAAASIWGARAGNGVIVITTKKGKHNQPMRAAFNMNVTGIDKPDQFYKPRMSSADFIEAEQLLFGRKVYAGAESSPYHAPITPAVELMIANRDGLLSTAAMQQQLEALVQQDVRSDIDRYLYRKAINQQYALNLNGGTDTHRYFFSAGWDKNLESLKENDYSRLSLNLNNSWRAIKGKLTFNTAIYYTENRSHAGNEGEAALAMRNTFPIYPYAQLADAQGTALPITKDYRLSFIRNAEAQGLLNWDYIPLDEIHQRKNTAQLSDYRINASVNYSIVDGLNAEVLYQYWRGNTVKGDQRLADSYFTRNLINQYSFISGGKAGSPVPRGAIWDQSHELAASHAVRGQLNYTKTIGAHSVGALAGYEVRELNRDRAYSRLYGYNDELATSNPVDYITYFDQYYYPGYFARIPYVNGVSSLTDRFVSGYGNATYTYQNKYSLSGSVRKDQSNLFGVRSNQRGVPLWSSGLGWTVNEENFYHLAAVPYLKLRATLGFNGNINKNISAYTTALSLGSDGLSGLPSSLIINPPNPDLRWERVRILNVGADFELKQRRLSGSIEFFAKKGIDLIGTTPYAPSTGITTFTGNTASTLSRGWDVILNSINTDGALKWNTTLLLSYVNEKVVSYATPSSATQLLQYGAGIIGPIAPHEGKPLYALYSYPSAGLDPATGNPLGYLEGIPSADYTAIIQSYTPETLIYHGPARPTTFGSLRNTLTWKNISFSVNMSYRLGYYFRNTSIRYGELLAGNVEHSDYALRWQKPGDEQVTHVPSLPDAVNAARDNVYLYSETLVQKGDHIRWQDATLAYTVDRAIWKDLPLAKVRFYTYANNLGILWKAASGPRDPDYPDRKPQRSIAFGVQIDF